MQPDFTQEFLAAHQLPDSETQRAAFTTIWRRAAEAGDYGAAGTALVFALGHHLDAAPEEFVRTYVTLSREYSTHGTLWVDDAVGVYYALGTMAILNMLVLPSIPRAAIEHTLSTLDLINATLGGSDATPLFNRILWTVNCGETEVAHTLVDEWLGTDRVQWLPDADSECMVATAIAQIRPEWSIPYLLEARLTEPDPVTRTDVLNSLARAFQEVGDADGSRGCAVEAAEIIESITERDGLEELFLDELLLAALPDRTLADRIFVAIEPRLDLADPHPAQLDDFAVSARLLQDDPDRREFVAALNRFIWPTAEAFDRRNGNTARVQDLVGRVGLRRPVQ